MNANAAGEEAATEIVLNRSMVAAIEISTTYANVILWGEGRSSSEARIAATASAARSFTPGDIVEVVLRRVAAQ